MNKKYMDFVPAGRTRKPVKASKTTTKTFASRTVGSAGVKTTKRTAVAHAPTRSSVSAGAKLAKNQRVGVSMKEAVRGPKSKAAEIKSAKQSESKIKTETRKSRSTFVPPKATFINQEKVVKRPLSKNTYQKRIEEKLKDTPTELPQGPVTIISKPEKDAKVGIIVTVILTIILGAAAGTVAFLLLPK